MQHTNWSGWTKIGPPKPVNTGTVMREGPPQTTKGILLWLGIGIFYGVVAIWFAVRNWS